MLNDNHVMNMINDNDKSILQNAYQIVLSRDADHVINHVHL